MLDVSVFIICWLPHGVGRGEGMMIMYARISCLYRYLGHLNEGLHLTVFDRMVMIVCMCLMGCNLYDEI